MVGPGTRLINGGGSHQIAEEEELTRWINESLDLPVLDPFGLWFHADQVKKAAREAVVGKFDKFTPSYYAATPEQKEAWWNRFKTQFKYQKYREPEVKAGFAIFVTRG
ncbi:uncharacterized protein LOC141611598 [Silene latifolia]|uniref:uncharacterized protein LOC141611598 n=1 Tax=Silene latifolia TaxID=37657 RepID=UPI003D77E4DF